MDFSNPFLAYAAVFFAGLIASASPCTLVIFPLIIGYVGGYADGDVKKSALFSALFALGLAITFTVLGAIAALTGELLGAVGPYWKYVLAAVAVLVGLQLLGVITLNVPTTGVARIKQRGLFGALFLGLLFGVASSPCATPILAVILAYVAANRHPGYGISLLFVYSLGYMVTIFAVGTFAGTATALLRSAGFRRAINWLQKASGLLFIAAGIYFFFVL
ncbi:MAG: cytochrome c biogenesis protein CcdA [Candidatus Margulisbacteria bacterium]|nr:cytochrome c biogenesis protein CcdA [Candidatus Margulisiibacteriota bacterium]